MSKQLEFLIKKDGSVQILDVAGAGQNCMSLTHDVEKLLGTVNESSRHTTSNFYKVETDNTVDNSL